MWSKCYSTLFTRLNGPCHRHKSCWLLKMSFYFSFIYFNHFLLLPTISIRFYSLATIMRPLFSNTVQPTYTHVIQYKRQRWSLQCLLQYIIWCASIYYYAMPTNVRVMIATLIGRRAIKLFFHA